MKENRITWVDIAKYICIMCVMNAHLESSTDPLIAIYEPFFLTLFFFSSGYVYSFTDNFVHFFRKKVAQLFVPWLVFSVANILVAQVFSFTAHNPLGIELFWNMMQIRGHGDGLWFVAALFIAFIPFFFLICWYEKTSIRLKRWWLLGISLFLSLLSNIYAIIMDPALLPWNDIALPWHLEYIFIAMFFMVLGYLFRAEFEVRFNKYNTLITRCVVWGIYLCAVLFREEITYNDSLNILVTYVCQLLGVAAVISVCKILPPNKMVLYIGQNTLLCFALHGKVYSLLQVVIRRCLPGLYSAILADTLCSSLFSLLLTVVLSLILIIPIWIINRWFPFLVGRRRIIEHKPV
ncbi:MAG: acyltransferase family protein [Oscillospiraceae bacterium]|nr:acyltransferase family protein [Oscillospiraceae bacterium]